MAGAAFTTRSQQTVVDASERTGPLLVRALVLADASNAARRPTDMRFTDDVEIEVVVARSHEEVHGLPRARQPIFDRCRHRVWLGPDDLVAHNPTVGE